MASSSTAPVGNTSSFRRKRAKRACAPCRQRKRKCNGELPCRTCQEWGYDCTYDERASSPGAQPPRPHEDAQRSQPPSITPQRSLSTAHRASASSSYERGIYAPGKGRFYISHSAIAFPRAVAVSLGAEDPPRLHSFAYNLGIIDEHFLRTPSHTLRDLLTLEDAENYLGRYTQSIVPVLGWTDEIALYQLWNGPVVLEAEACFSFALLLGSLFSWPNQLSTQEQLLQYAQSLLDRSSFNDAPWRLHVDHARAWVLRSLYLRCTTRPNMAWISSSIMVHVTESLGLHQEPQTMDTLGLGPISMSAGLLEERRSTYWTAWAFNQMISYDIGRTATFVSGQNIGTPENTNCFIKTYRALYNGGDSKPLAEPEMILSEMTNVPESSSFGRLLQADFACALFRDIQARSTQPPESVGRDVVDLATEGLKSARELCDRHEPWWLLVNMPFQLLCIAIISKKPYFLGLVPAIITTLKHVGEVFDTHMTREAYATARKFLEEAMASSDREITAIKRGLASLDDGIDLPSAGLEEPDWQI